MKKTINNLLILEDHLDAQQWLCSAAQLAFPDTEIEVVDRVETAISTIGEQPLDLALIDLNLPDGSGVEVIKTLLDLQPQALAVVTTIYDDDQYIFPALRAGADGYLLKDQSKESLADSLQGIIKGQPPLSPAVAAKIMRYFSSSEDQLSLLTKREKEVLKLIAQSLTLKEVAEKLFVSENTTATHVKKIYSKLNISSRAEATRIAERSGLLD